MKQLLLLLALIVSQRYTLAADIQWAPTALATANTSRTGAAGTHAMVFAAKEETFVHKLIIRSAGDNAATALRVFLNNGEATTTAKNNVLFAESTLESTSTSEVAALATEEVELGVWIPAGYRVFVTIGTAGTDGWHVSAVTGEGYAGRYLP